MEQRLLAVRENYEDDINIGDYIQALAASQFFQYLDGWVERELLKEYNGEFCKVIMNAWYMHNSRQWPPSNKILPLFVAMHINSMVKDRFLQPDSISYLKNFEPIGCRDIYTLNLLNSKGINAYFSGCLTLTLGYKYKTSKCSGKTYIVEPYFRVRERSLLWKFKALLTFIHHPLTTLIIRNKRDKNKMFTIGSVLDNACFLKTYSELFDLSFLRKSVYISQEGKEYSKNLSNDELLNKAEELVKLYSEASLVVTSRIHCALPCTALEVPVLYVEDKNQPENSKCRLGGLLDLFNIIQLDNTKLVPLFSIEGKINKTNYPPLKKNYKPLAEQLVNTCKTFMNKK